MKLIAIFLLVVIAIPAILLGLLVTPWLFLIGLGLLLLFPLALSPSTSRDAGLTREPGFLAKALFGIAILFGGFVLAVGLLVDPWFFLLMLLICAPLLWLLFSPE
jgi:hypothetical protein